MSRTVMKKRRAALVHRVYFFLAALLASGPALGQERLAANESGSAADQLDMDITPVPVGMGAIFVPSMTRPELEPQVVVFFKGERVAWGQTGERLVLPPGVYTVSLGHGAVEDRPSAEVRVIDGVTTPVEPFFAALRVTAVDVDGNAVATGYALEAPSGEGWGEGRTSDSASYGATRTWILPAVPVTIDLGDGGSVAIPLSRGQLVRYRLVLDRGALVRAEMAEREVVVKEKWWRLRWVVGGDFSFNRTAGQLGAFNGDSWRLGLFTRAELGVDTGPHLALLNLSVEESWISFESLDGQELSPQKLSDEARAELLYNFRLGGIVGPYVRAEARTSFFETNIRPPRATAVSIEDAQGRETASIRLGAGQEFALFDSLNPLVLRESAGLGFSLVDNDTATIGLRMGFSARQAFYSEGLFLADRDGDTLRLIRLSDDKSFGPEASLILGLRLGQSFSWEAIGDLYVPTEQLNEANALDEFVPIVRLDNTFTLSINRFLSVVYNLKTRREAFEIDDLQISHSLSLRLQHTLF